MKDNKRSEYVEKMHADICKRIENAEKFFAEHPESKKKYMKYFNEMLWRQDFLETAIRTLAVATKNKTNTSEMFELFDRLYCYSLSDHMYETEKEKDRYFEMIFELRDKYPSKELSLVFAIRNIKDSINQERGYAAYLKTLRLYVETLSDYFIWFRNMVAKLPPSEEPKEPKECTEREIEKE